ncbi:MAG: hypothetical protein ACKO9T_09845, partial [Nitrospira sp.]
CTALLRIGFSQQVCVRLVRSIAVVGIGRLRRQFLSDNGWQLQSYSRGVAVGRSGRYGVFEFGDCEIVERVVKNGGLKGWHACVEPIRKSGRTTGQQQACAQETRSDESQNNPVSGEV